MWKAWQQLFNARRDRPVPPISAPDLEPEVQQALARSLARFQLGEAGEGRIASQIYHVRIGGIDDTYRAALGLFCAEEGRHARMLAVMVKALGGTLLTHHWTNKGFLVLRRLMGVRLKLMVLLAAEVIGIAFYGAVSALLPAGSMRNALRSICQDEMGHLHFHCDFIGTQPAVWRPVLLAAFAAVTALAGLAVLIDHSPTLWRLWRARVLAVPDTDHAHRLT